MSVAIIDYGSGNLHSAAKAFERAARASGTAQPIIVTSDPEEVRGAERVVLPGVGAFADCRRGLDGVPGMVEALTEVVRQRGRPFLGICVGMQLMAERGREYEVSRRVRLDRRGGVPHHADRPGPKIPHMGWNTLDRRTAASALCRHSAGPARTARLFRSQLPSATPPIDADLVAEADYGGPVTALVARDNYAGTQFHPEKSQKLGLALIANFLNWKP